MEQEGTSFQRSDQGDVTTMSSWRKDSGMQRSHQTLITDRKSVIRRKVVFWLLQPMLDTRNSSYSVILIVIKSKNTELVSGVAKFYHMKRPKDLKWAIWIWLGILVYL